MNRILITGGAGFVGSSLARKFAAAGDSVTVVDNFHRRGSERNVVPLRGHGVTVLRGDMRLQEDLQELPGDYDYVIDAAAEPSVHAGVNGSPRYLLDTNLVGAMNILEFCRVRHAGLMFLSTSRVYSIDHLCSLPLTEGDSAFSLKTSSLSEGISRHGINEEFPVTGYRSLYGSSKLAAEMLIEEYCRTYGVRAWINRCGVISGPGQFGKSDQGVFALWVARHRFGGELTYTGFGGRGRQVRDLLHPDDLYELLQRQLQSGQGGSAEVFNVGGGPQNAVSLQEYTEICREVTGANISIAGRAESSPVDIPYYVSDNSKVCKAYDWQPRKGVASIVQEIDAWLQADESGLRELFK